MIVLQKAYTSVACYKSCVLDYYKKNGHRPIVLLGGGTTRIGDPSGKDKTRKILSEEEIEKNIKNIKNILKKFLDNDNPETKPIFVNNYTWLKI